MELATLKRKLMQGSLAGLLRVGLAVPLYLVLTPYILNSLGPELFALWAFGSLVMNVMTLSDFGFKSGLIYFIARNLDQQEHVNRYFTVTLCTYVFMALAMLGLTLGFGEFIAAVLLEVPERLVTETEFVLWITAAGFGLRFISIAFQALLEAHQEHARVQFILLLWLGVNFVATVVALWLQPDIYALGLAAFAANLILLGAFCWSVLRQYPRLDIRLAYLRLVTFKSMLGYGGGIQLAALVIGMREPVLKILLARGFDLASVATFELVYKLCSQLVSVVVTPLLGSFSAATLLAKERVQELESVLRPMFAFCITVFVPMILFLATFAPVMIKFWLGPGYQHVARLVPWVFAAFAVYYTTETLYKALEASGMAWYSALVQGLSLAMSITAFVIFRDDANIAIVAAIISGFLSFSLLNAAVFRWRFPTVRLCRPAQWAWLLAPAAAYLLLQRHVTADYAPPLFLLYAVLHAACVRKAGLFDMVGAARRLAQVVGART